MWVVSQTVLLLNLLIAILSKTFIPSRLVTLATSYAVSASRAIRSSEELFEQGRIFGGTILLQQCSGFAHSLTIPALSGGRRINHFCMLGCNVCDLVCHDALVEGSRFEKEMQRFIVPLLEMQRFIVPLLDCGP